MTSIGAINPPVDLAVIVIRPDAILEAVSQAAAPWPPELADPTRRDLPVASPDRAGIIHLDPAKRFAVAFLRDCPPSGERGRCPGATDARHDGPLPGKAGWFTTMERPGVPMFNDAEGIAEAAGLLARYLALRNAASAGRLPTVTFRDHSTL